MAKAFQQFIQQKEKGAKKKERIRQEKKQVRKETQEYFAKKKAERYQQRTQDGFDAQAGRGGIAASAEGRQKGGKGSKAVTTDDRGKGDRGYTAGAKGRTKSDHSSFDDRTRFDKGAKSRGSFKPSRIQTGKAGTDIGASFSKERGTSDQKKATSSKGKTTSSKEETDPLQGRPAFSREKADAAQGKPSSLKGKGTAATGKPTKAGANTGAAAGNTASSSTSMPLNKFIAHAGICSRRDAADVVKSGKVTVNGTLINEPGFKVTGKDLIKVNGKPIAVRRNLVYILLNKPKDFITTTEDPQGRKTVLDIVRNATTERVYPIGRLDRNTTGVLLLTNDGELAQKLAHPSYEIKKIYEVKLDKPLTKSDFDKITNGIQLEDGFIAPDTLAYADAKDKSVIGIEIHSGRNRIVRRIFEAIGYDVRNLDRVMYANLTKKNVDRGKWRFLTEKEVRLLKFLNASYTRNKPARRG